MPILIYMTASSDQEAKKIAQALIEKKLVACANIFPAHQSLYWWDGAVQNEAEIAVIFKTRAELFDAVEVEIKALHSYDVPCIVSWPLNQGHAPFLQWIGDVTNIDGA